MHRNSDNDDDNRFFVGEYELHDEPLIPDWINATLDTLAFDDVETDNDEEQCSVCHGNQRKAAYVPCGHMSLCLRCKHGMEIAAAAIKEYNPGYQQPCVTCRQQTTDIIIIIENE